MTNVREQLEASMPERVYRKSQRDYRNPQYGEFEVYVLGGTACEKAFLGSGVGLVERANFEVLVEHFESEGWDWLVSSQAFAVPVDSPNEVIEFLVDVVSGLENYPLIDEEAYMNMEHQEVLDYIDELAESMAEEFEVEVEDIMQVVRDAVFDEYDFDGVHVVCDEVYVRECVRVDLEEEVE